MDRGYRPEELERLTKEERLIYLAMAELNEEKRVETMKRAFAEVLMEFYNIGGD